MSSAVGGDSIGINTFEMSAIGNTIAFATPDAALAVGTNAATAMPIAANAVVATTTVTTRAGIELSGTDTP